ncbi:SCO family protein [Aureimonas sp. Leaf324]|uniref:SCO family protein n=1 Tax=Aureimonas sp. Leaf324 TaxID=1736336 RepID=UPI0006FB20DF|nr:SCO family protein [Aureimonas sp. Leaf324]KQQ91510.1 electron transporter [Aureimonas sp. Leaf324]
MSSPASANRMLAIGGLVTLLGVLLTAVGFVYVGQAEHSAVKRPFALVDTAGRTVTEHVFEGRPSLVYFGYTNCPEVCPTTLIEMADWLNELGPEGRDLQALFFTIDPERDTPDVVGPYVASISDRIVGVTGSEAEMHKASQAWLVVARKNGDGNDYHMKHTTSLLLVGRDGRLKGLIPYATPREEAIDKIRQVLLRQEPVQLAGT